MLIVIVAAIIALVVLILILIAFDRSYNKGNNFYPTPTEIAILNIKLFIAPWIKGSKWKQLVRKDDAELNTDVLTRVIQFEPKIDHINDFKKVCQLNEEDKSIPFLYPSAVVLYPNVCLMAAPEYPFPAVGSVHVYNTTTLFKKLDIDQKFTCVIKADKTIRHVKKGSEVEFISTLTDNKSNELVWSNSSKFLIMHNTRKRRDSLARRDSSVRRDIGGSRKSFVTDVPQTGRRDSGVPLTGRRESNVWGSLGNTTTVGSNSGNNINLWNEPDEKELTLLHETLWNLSSTVSLEYASVSKDYNPIHTSTIAAKIFGFQGIIIHGMYMIARAASGCQQIMGTHIKYPLEVSTKFQRPCVLPQDVTFRVYSIKGDKGQLYFSVKSKNDKILLDGYLKSNKV